MKSCLFDSSFHASQPLFPVPPQVVDQAMSLLTELQQVRRVALRNLEDAQHAVETSFLEAQKQWGDRVDELKSSLLVRNDDCKS